MMRKPRLGLAVGLVGVAFLLFYLAVRLTIIVQLDAAVEEANVHSLSEVVANLSPAIALWLLWVYSFRLGMVLAIVAGALYSGVGRRGILLLVVGAIAYLATCYLPFVDYSPRYYGILGTGILIVFLLLVRDWALRRRTVAGPARVACDLRIAGYFFLVMATWSLCGIFGIVTYALQPEAMIARGLQPAAQMLTSHVMAELTLGWCLLLAASRKDRVENSQAPQSPSRGDAATATATAAP
jgi:hypothetical protein